MKRFTIFAIAIVAVSLFIGCTQELELTAPEKPIPLSIEARAIQPERVAPSTVYFDWTITGGREPFTFAWDFNDETYLTASKPDKVYEQAGEYRVIVTVTDADKQKASDTLEITVLEPGTLQAFAIAIPPRGVLPFTSTLVGTARGGNGDYAFVWSTLDGIQIAMGPNMEFTPSQIGTNSFVLTVTSSDGQLAKDTVTVEALVESLPNTPPLLVLEVTPTNGLINQTVITVSTAGSSDDSKIKEFRCRFGDGTADTTAGTTFTHIYASTGLFDILVEAVDDSGAVSSDSRSVLITDVPANKPPVITMVVDPIMGIAGQTQITYAATAIDSDGVITNTLWEFGDGSSAHGLVTSHVYGSAGFYMVTFSATDNDGATTSDQRYVWVTETDEGPTVDTTCWSQKQNLCVTLTNPYKTGAMNNPAGLSRVTLTVIENHGKPDMIYGFALVQGDKRIPFVIPDHKPNSHSVDTILVQLPQEVILQANQKFEWTYQDGPNSNSVTLIKIEGCTYK